MSDPREAPSGPDATRAAEPLATSSPDPTLNRRALELEAARNEKSPVLLGLLISGALLAGGGIGFAVSTALAKPEAAAAPAPSAAPPPPAPPPPTFLELARKGDHKALDTLDAKKAAERTLEETVALAHGKRASKKLAFESFSKKARADADAIVRDTSQLERIRDSFLDRQTAEEAAELLVSLPGTMAADMLFQIWTKSKVETEATDFARELLFAKDFADKISPALRVALELRTQTECEALKEVLVRANEHGDQRSLRQVLKLNDKRGCGEKKADDCYECLRPPRGDKEALTVTDVVRAIRKRKAPEVP